MDESVSRHRRAVEHLRSLADHIRFSSEELSTAKMHMVMELDDWATELEEEGDSEDT